MDLNKKRYRKSVRMNHYKKQWRDKYCSPKKERQLQTGIFKIIVY